MHCTGFRKDNNINNQQDAKTFSFINLFNSALHVSGDKFAHPQEHFFDCIYSFWYNAPTLLPAGATVEMELTFHLNERVVASCWLVTSLYYNDARSHKHELQEGVLYLLDIICFFTVHA